MIGWTALAGLGALGLWAGWIEPRSLRVRRFRRAMPGLDAPVRALAIGDIQAWRHHWPARRLRAAFARAAGERPDIVFWLGDYYDEPTGPIARLLSRRPATARAFARLKTPMAEIADAMGRLRGPMGAFAVLGNHDWAWSGAAVADALRAAGVTPLIAEAAEAVHPVTGARLTVLGLDDASSDRPTGWERLSARARPPVVALTHAPGVWPALFPRPALTLAGHTHAGQVAPFGRRIVHLPRASGGFVHGWRGDEGGWLYVTAGLGTSPPPLRLNARPEIVVIDLEPAPLPPAPLPPAAPTA